MNSHLITPGSLSGKAEVPPSKSHTMRALLFALLGEGRSVIQNPLKSPDTAAMIRSLVAFGARVERGQKGSIKVDGVSGCPLYQGGNGFIDAGNSGQVFRFMTSVAALQSEEALITGDESIQKRRPILPLLKALSKRNATVMFREKNQIVPFSIKGPISGGKIEIEGTDSQLVSSLLMTTPFLKGKTEIEVKNPGELPWIRLTLDWLKKLGIPFENRGFSKYTLFGNASIKGFSMTIPGDWSAAAFLIGAALVTSSSLTICDLDPSDCQGDKKVVSYLQKMGAIIQVEKSRITVLPSTLTGISIDINECIDALPMLSVIGCYAKGKMHLYNAKMARFKESDRIDSITRELQKMNAKIEEEEDSITIHHSPLKGSLALSSHSDHRIAMALVVAALGAKGNSTLIGTSCINKSFPHFFEELSKIGGKITPLKKSLL